MRGKEDFIEAFEDAAKPEVLSEVNPVEMGAHSLRHREEPFVVLEPEHTIDGCRRVFKFKKIQRPSTDEESAELVDDFMYVGCSVERTEA